MPVISLYWFAAQQKTSILKCQNYSLLDSNSSVESIGFVPAFYKEHEVA